MLFQRSGKISWLLLFVLLFPVIAVRPSGPFSPRTVFGQQGDGSQRYIVYLPLIVTSNKGEARVAPVASFDSSSPDLLGETTTFVNTSAGSNLGYAWDFGDGSPVAGDVHPSHVYATVGVFTVVLTATNSAGYDVASAQVVVETPPEPVSGLMVRNDGPKVVGDVITLAATVERGSDVQYVWKFGDGSGGVGATGRSPVRGCGSVIGHSYAEVGTYTAVVTAFNRVSSETATTVVAIEDAPPVASFDSSSPDLLGETTTFVNTSTGSNLGYAWDFGDGSPVAGDVHPSHVYATVGVFTVVLTATNSAGYDVTFAQIVVETPPPEPICGLSVSNDGPKVVGDVITLTATVKIGQEIRYVWDYGDGSVGVGGDGSMGVWEGGAVVGHSYAEAGTYTAVVTAFNRVSSETATTAVTIEDVPPVASFDSSSPDLLGEMTTFVNTSAGSNLGYTWDFGDGSPAEGGVHPSHVYAVAGVFTVVLTATNSAGYDVASAQVVVEAQRPGVFELVAVHPSAVKQSTSLGRTLFSAFVYEGMIYWGYGDKNYNTGPIDVIPFDPNTLTFLPTERVAQTEAIYHYRLLSNGKLYIPHIDPYGGLVGKDYSRRDASGWTQTQVGLYHIYDIVEMNGNVYLVGSRDYDAVVYESSDSEASFHRILRQPPSFWSYARFFFAIVMDGRLYVQASNNYGSERSPTSRAYDGQQWRDGPDLLPQGGHGSYSNHFADQVVYKSMGGGSRALLYAFDGVQVRTVRSDIVDYTIYGDRLLVLGMDGRIAQTTDLVRWEVVSGSSVSSPRSIAVVQGRIFIGNANARIYRSAFTIDTR